MCALLCMANMVADARDQSASCLDWVTGHMLLIRLQQRPLFGFLVNPFGTTARATELQGDHLLVTAQSRSAIFSKLATIPVVCRSGSLNRTLMVRQNCTAASENTAGRPGLPSCGASQVMSLSSQIGRESRLFSEAL